MREEFSDPLLPLTFRHFTGGLRARAEDASWAP